MKELENLRQKLIDAKIPFTEEVTDSTHGIFYDYSEYQYEAFCGYKEKKLRAYASYEKGYLECYGTIITKIANKLDINYPSLTSDDVFKIISRDYNLEREFEIRKDKLIESLANVVKLNMISIKEGKESDN